MSTMLTLAGIAVGGGLGYVGGQLAPRWTSRPPRKWEVLALAGLNGLFGGLLAAGHPLNHYFWQQMLFISLLTTASLVDLHDRIIPNELVTFGLALGLILLLVLPYPDKSWVQGVLGAAAGFGLLLFLALLVRGGMGLGDVKLGAVIGLFLGLKWVMMGLVLAFLLGGLAGGTMLLLRMVRRKDHIPFGPYLALGAIITAIYGTRIWTWYTSI